MYLTNRNVIDRLYIS